MVESPGEASVSTRREVILAGHRGDGETARAGLRDDDPLVRGAALGALERMGALADATLADALDDPNAAVRRRAAEIAAAHPAVDLNGALGDDDPRVVEAAAWGCGERETPGSPLVPLLITIAQGHADDLVRESAVAALGAIGDERAVDTVVAAVDDKLAVRRRAVLALAPFIGDDHPDVDDALRRALDDRNWQVRQAAEDLTERG